MGHKHARTHWEIIAPLAVMLLVAAFTLGDIVRPAAQSGLSETATIVRREASVQAASGVAAMATAATNASGDAQAATQLSTASTTVNWRAPSETKPYPKVSDHPKLRLEVSVANQRVYLYDGKTLLYTMFASTGTDNTTPVGHYKIEAERGDYFYNSQEQLGAHYYTSFHQHGTYLFHTVPTDSKGHYIASEAAKLGKQPGSHGCVRLTIADAKWLMNHVKTGTAVHIY